MRLFYKTLTIISLLLIPTLGYSSTLLSTTDRQSDKCKNGIPGCGGVTTYTFKALEKGTGKLKLQYDRQWENNKSGVRVINVFVK